MDSKAIMSHFCKHVPLHYTSMLDINQLPDVLNEIRIQYMLRG
jgi:hypothetical protein